MTVLLVEAVKRRIRTLMRALPDDAPEGSVEAFPTVYEVTYNIGWGWKERIKRGAFAESLAANPTMPLFWEHLWSDAPIGSGDGTDEERGVRLQGLLYLDLDPKVRRIYQAMKDGAVAEWSIAFYPRTIEIDEEDPMLDIIVAGDLVESSVVVRGANPDTETIDLRSRTSVRLEGDGEREVARLRSLAGDPPPPPGLDLEAVYASLDRPDMRALLRSSARAPSSA